MTPRAQERDVSGETETGDQPWLNDPDVEAIRVVKVTPDASGWTLQREDGWSFWCPPESPVEPRAGMVARFYGKGMGYVVRGLFLDEHRVFYRTLEEQERKSDDDAYGKDSADLLARWDEGRGCWSVEMGGIGPGYEQAIQITAFEMLRRLVETKPDPEALRDNWPAISADLDKALKPVLDVMGLSGAQYGAAINLAAMIYRHGPTEAIKGADRERRIQVSKNFPRLDVQP